MAYKPYEVSEHDSNPVEFYMFSSAGFDEDYYFTSSDTEITHESNIYTPVSMNRTQPEISRESAAQNISITMPRNNPLAKRWITFVPPRAVFVKIHRLHRNDGAQPEVYVYWQGKVRGVSWSGNEANLECQPIDTAFSRVGLRAKYSVPCRHFLFSVNSCKVPAEDFREEAIITSINGDELTSPRFGAFPNGDPVPLGWWTAGFVENPINGDMRQIIEHKGPANTVVKLTAGFEQIQVGDLYNVYSGCNRTAEVCLNKYNNIANYGGIALYISSGNPFTQKLV